MIRVEHSAAAEAFLHEANIAVLATVDGRGRPHATPVWYLYEDGGFVISTTRTSGKFRNILTNPEVTIVVDRRTIPYLAVIVRGTADAGPALSDAELLRLAVRYYGEDVGREYAARGRAENEVTIRVRPQAISEALAETGRAQESE
jgi:PPOX class probable F420-dependent enzyme